MIIIGAYNDCVVDSDTLNGREPNQLFFSCLWLNIIHVCVCESDDFSFTIIIIVNISVDKMGIFGMQNAFCGIAPH